MGNVKEFKQMIVGMVFLPPFFGLILFSILSSFGVQLTVSLLLVSLFAVLLFVRLTQTHMTVALDAQHLYLRNKLKDKKVSFQDIISMSFGASILKINEYHIRLRNGEVLSIPLMDEFSEFEKEMEKRAALVLVGESLVNKIQFRIMTPKNRRWTKEGVSYQSTSALDSVDPSYMELERALPVLFLAGFVLGLFALFSGIMSSN